MRFYDSEKIYYEVKYDCYREDNDDRREKIQ